MSITATARFASPALLRLGRPPAIAVEPVETIIANAKSDLVARMSAIGVTYDVGALETDSGVVLSEAAALRDYLRRQEIDDAVAETYLGLAAGPLLDLRCADYGVLRREISAPDPTVTVEPARPSSVPPAWSWTLALPRAAAPGWLEDDESLRSRGFLAWQALSVAGPAGAYVFLAKQAHPDVRDVAVYGPETGYVTPGQVLLVVQSYSGTGVPSAEVLDAIAAFLDAWQVTYASGATQTRPVRDQQSVRPLGAQVFVGAAQPFAYYVAGTLYVPAGTDASAIQSLALARLAGYQDQRNHIGLPITLSGLSSALSVADANGLPTVDEVALSAPSTDVVPAYNQIVQCSTITLQVVVR